MSATRMHRDGDAWVLESFDHRSRFSFDDFLLLLTNCLQVDVTSLPRHLEVPHATFTFRAIGFRVSWTDELGCHVRGDAEDESALRAMARAITFGEAR